jgi:hypothetical protein
MIVLAEDLRKRLASVQTGSFWIGLALLLGGFVGGAFRPEAFYPGYLAGYLFWLGLALGSMAILMVHYQVGGTWGYVTRRILEASMGTLPLLAVLFIPILFGRRTLFAWTASPGSSVRHLDVYMSPLFFLLRAGVCFGGWLLWAFLLGRWSRRRDQKDDPRLQVRLYRLSGAGLPIYAFLMFFASVDWIMALEPSWSSTIIGLIAVAGQAVSGFALAIAVLAALSGSPPLADVVSSERLIDLGNLLLTSVMLWGYVAFSQYLIIWSGDLPREVPWYVHRSTPGWSGMSMALIALHLGLPIALLLFRGLKRSARFLGAIAWGMLALRLIEGFWEILPSFEPEGPSFHWPAAAATVGIGGLWIALFLHRLLRSSLLPLHDGEFSVVLQEARIHG